MLVYVKKQHYELVQNIKPYYKHWENYHTVSDCGMEKGRFDDVRCYLFLLHNSGASQQLSCQEYRLFSIRNFFQGISYLFSDQMPLGP